MYCTKCGQTLKDKVNFCGNCGTPTEKSTETSHPEVKKESHLVLKTEDEKIKVKYDDKAMSVFTKIFIAAIISLFVGLITYPISNSILEVDKENLSLSDYSFNLRAGANNAAIRRDVLKEKSVKNAKIATIISFITVLGSMFIRMENKGKRTEITQEKVLNRF